MDNRAIGIFDSGVGGLTVLAEIRKNLPNENIIYLGDTKNFPYGNRTKEEIIEFSIQNVKTLIAKDVKTIVIACGTATSQALDVLKEKFDIPIIGIIEPTVQYVKSQNYKEIGVIATEGTIRSGAWEQKLKQSIHGIKVTNKACPMLAEIALYAFDIEPLCMLAIVLDAKKNLESKTVTKGTIFDFNLSSFSLSILI